MESDGFISGNSFHRTHPRWASARRDGCSSGLCPQWCWQVTLSLTTKAEWCIVCYLQFWYDYLQYKQWCLTYYHEFRTHESTFIDMMVYCHCTYQFLLYDITHNAVWQPSDSCCYLQMEQVVSMKCLAFKIGKGLTAVPLISVHTTVTETKDWSTAGSSYTTPNSNPDPDPELRSNKAGVCER